jgi:hypothetical protein
MTQALTANNDAIPSARHDHKISLLEILDDVLEILSEDKKSLDDARQERTHGSSFSSTDDSCWRQ